MSFNHHNLSSSPSSLPPPSSSTPPPPQSSPSPHSLPPGTQPSHQLSPSILYELVDESPNNISPSAIPNRSSLPELTAVTTGTGTGSTGSRDAPTSGNRRTSSSASQAQRPSLRVRRQSRQERIDEILDQAHQRGLTMRRYSQGQLSSTASGFGGAISRTMSGNALPPLASRTLWENGPVDVIEPLNGGGGGGDSSADERTSMVRNNREAAKNYQSTHSSIRSRRPSSIRPYPENGRPLSGLGHRLDDDEGDEDGDHETKWKRILSRFGSLELENKGSVARDHLALERTFLAWLRTSLAFASIGIAVTQLFRLNSSISGDSSRTDAYVHLRQLGKPLGATFLGISIMTLFVGFHRYFESQHWIVRGKFPAGRGSIAVITGVAFALMVTSLVVVVVVDPGAYEK